MKVNEEKLVQIAVDYVAALVSGNRACVQNKSSQGMLIETDSATWRVQIEKIPRLLMYYPRLSGAYIFANKQALQDAVDGIDRGVAVERRRAMQEYIRAHKEHEWIFEITGDPVSKRLRLEKEASDDTQMLVLVKRDIYPAIDHARKVAEALVEMCNAFLVQSVWIVSLYQKKKMSKDWEVERKRNVYGVSHILMTMIELLTRSELIPPGHGLCGVLKTL